MLLLERSIAFVPQMWRQGCSSLQDNSFPTMILNSHSGRSSFARAENRYPGLGKQKKGDEMDGQDCSALLVLTMNESGISKKAQGILSGEREK